MYVLCALAFSHGKSINTILLLYIMSTSDMKYVIIAYEV